MELNMKLIRSYRRLGLLAAATLAMGSLTHAQVADQPDARIADIAVNYTESKVGDFALPDVLKLSDGTPVTDAKTWLEQRRPEIVRFYETQVYGRVPDNAPAVTWEVFNIDRQALGGTAVMKTLLGHMGGPGAPIYAVTLYTPANASGPVPVLVHINFNFGFNMPAPGAPPRAGGRGPASLPATAGARRGRGRGAAAAPVPQRGGPAELISHGFAYALIYHNSIETDYDGMLNQNIVRKLAPPYTADSWGTISAWAWGISRFVDYLETDSSVDARRVAIYGVSRLGKTVLWEGVHDTRIAAVIASCGGEGGAAIARRNYGETIAHLVAPGRYPYQFAANYQKYAAHPELSPMDTHMLVAAMAPRPLLLQTGNTDNWSDPKGEFVAAVNATPVYKLLGKQGIDTDQMPQAGQLVGKDLSYFMHQGGHGTMPGDWDVFIKFLETNLKPGT
jgi:hypothetical protein